MRAVPRFLREGKTELHFFPAKTYLRNIFSIEYEAFEDARNLFAEKILNRVGSRPRVREKPLRDLRLAREDVRN